MRGLAVSVSLSLGIALCLSSCLPRQPGSVSKLAAPVLGRQIETMILESIDGQRYTLDGMAARPAIVLAWTGVGCPMSRVYLPRLKSLAEEFRGTGVQFFLINSNAQDSRREIREVAREQALGFPTIRDRGGALARKLGMTRTTEVIALDRKRSVVYHGAVDDQYGYRRNNAGEASSNSLLTYRQEQPSENYLRDALRSILAGQPVARPETDPLGCALGLDWKNWDARASLDVPELTFHEDIEELLQQNCQGCHHEGGSAPFALTDYRKVLGWAEMIKEVVSERRMPPWNADPAVGSFKNDRSLTREQIDRVVRWVDLGAPRGDPAKAPEELIWPESWAIGEPDVVLTTPEFTVPAEGRIPYRYVTVPVNLHEDRWVQAAQVTSTANEVVHHVLVFVKESRASRKRKDRPWSPRWGLDTLFGHLSTKARSAYTLRLARYGSDLWNNSGGGLFGYFLAVLPGELPTVFPEGQAQFLPAGASLTFQIHYQPLGKKVTSKTSLGIKFRKEPPTKVREVWSATSVTFAIPPGSASHPEQAEHRFQRGGTLLSLKPHMHLRGSSVRYVLEHLDGSKETLLHVPNYDFDWQHTYELAAPRRVDKGETLHVLVTFDNSAGNPYNPDPSRTVYFGIQNDEEMLIGYFEMIWDQELQQTRS